MSWKTADNFSDSLVILGRLLSTKLTLLNELEDYCQLKGLSCMTWKTTDNLSVFLYALLDYCHLK